MKPAVDSLTYEPCPRAKFGCTGKMLPIPGEKKAWRCDKCGGEFWRVQVPTWKDWQDFKESHQPQKLMSVGYVPTKKKGKSGKSRKRKKKGQLHKNYYFENTPKK